MSRMMRWINWWPPLLGAGIRMTRMDPGMRSIDAEMRLRAWNRNYVGVHFGGSLFALTDPFYMVMLAHNLGPDYIVWDKAASIRYRKPGRGTVRAQFRLTDEVLATVRATLETESKYEPKFTVLIHDQAGDVVAEVERVIYCAKRSVHEARRRPRPA